jgi:hypothetical protein
MIRRAQRERLASVALSGIIATTVVTEKRETAYGPIEVIKNTVRKNMMADLAGELADALIAAGEKREI